MIEFEIVGNPKIMILEGSVSGNRITLSPEHAVLLRDSIPSVLTSAEDKAQEISAVKKGWKYLGRQEVPHGWRCLVSDPQNNSHLVTCPQCPFVVYVTCPYEDSKT